MDEWSISVEEVMRITKKSRDFILNAIEQGVMPGSVVKHDSVKEVLTSLERLSWIT